MLNITSSDLVPMSFLEVDGSNFRLYNATFARDAYCDVKVLGWVDDGREEVDVEASSESHDTFAVRP